MIIRDWMSRVHLCRAGFDIIMQLMQLMQAGSFVPGRKVENVHESMTRSLSVDCAIGGYLRASLSSSSNTSWPREY